MMYNLHHYKTKRKWSKRKAAAFIVATNAIFWAVVIFVVLYIVFGGQT